MTTFEKLIDGLRLYEVILLLCGSVLFIVLLIVLCILITQKRTIKPVAVFFCIAILMLVWPSIQKISIESLGASIEKNTSDYALSPTKEKKEEIEKSIAILKSKQVEDPLIVTEIAKAQYAIGNDKQAALTITSLPEETQNTANVKELKQSIMVSTALKKQISLVEQRPADTAAAAKLNTIQKKAQMLPNKSEMLEKNISIADKKISAFRVRKSLTNER